jgi:hypothetical protein
VVVERGRERMRSRFEVGEKSETAAVAVADAPIEKWKKQRKERNRIFFSFSTHAVDT